MLDAEHPERAQQAARGAEQPPGAAGFCWRSQEAGEQRRDQAKAHQPQGGRGHPERRLPRPPCAAELL